MGDEARTIRIVERDGDVVRIVGESPAGTIVVIASLSVAGTTLVLKDAHLDGTGPGSLGMAELREFTREPGRQFEMDVVEIYGGRRTAGARTGRLPRPIRIDVDRLRRQNNDTTDS